MLLRVEVSGFRVLLLRSDGTYFFLAPAMVTSISKIVWAFLGEGRYVFFIA